MQIPAIYASQITNISIVERLQDLLIVSLESCSIRHPLFFRPEVLVVELKSQIHHLVELVLQA